MFLPSVADTISCIDLTLINCALPTTLGAVTLTSGEVHSLEPGGCAKNTFPKSGKTSVKRVDFITNPENTGKHWHAKVYPKPKLNLEFLSIMPKL